MKDEISKSTWVENYLGIDIYKDDYEYPTPNYWCEVRDFETGKYHELNSSDIDTIKSWADPIIAKNHYIQLTAICDAYHIDYDFVKCEDELVSRINKFFQKTIMAALEEI